MNNKAVNESFIKYMILALVVLLILFFIFSNVLKIIPGTGEDARCESYVKLASVLKNPLTKEARINMNSACPTKVVEIKSKGSDETTIKNNALDEVLNQMYLCGKRWGFKDGEVIYKWFNQWKDSDNVCVVCSDISFDARLKGMNQLNGLWLRSTEINAPGSSKKMIESLTGLSDISKLKSDLQKTKDTIFTQKKTYVIYEVNMRTTAESFWKKVGIGSVTGTVGGGIIAAAALPITIFTGGTGAIILSGVLIGGVAGGYIGANVKDTTSAQLFVVSGDAQTLTNTLVKECKTLGRDQSEDLWKDEVG